MTTYVVATDGVHTSAALCDYLDGRVEPGDEVHAVNSLRGGDATDSDDVRDGEDALNAVAARLGGVATVETHQFVRGNSPVEDVLDHVHATDADEVVFGVHKRTHASEVLFGSVARDILSNAAVPMVVIPLDSG